MRCPYCGHGDPRVLDSRPSPDGDAVKRRRECPGCARRFNTVERVERRPLYVAKRAGGREEFDRRKVFDSMRIAARKRPVSLERLELAAEAIERDLTTRYEDEVPTQAVGERVMRELSTIDTVAYVRFASVYRDFSTVADFSEIVDRTAREEADARFEGLQAPLIPEDLLSTDLLPSA